MCKLIAESCPRLLEAGANWKSGTGFVDFRSLQSKLCTVISSVLRCFLTKSSIDHLFNWEAMLQLVSITLFWYDVDRQEWTSDSLHKVMT